MPGLERRFVDVLMQIDAALGLGTPNVALPPLALFFANLAGALGVLWAFVATEAVGAVAQIWALRHLPRRRSGSLRA